MFSKTTQLSTNRRQTATDKQMTGAPSDTCRYPQFAILPPDGSISPDIRAVINAFLSDSEATDLVSK